MQISENVQKLINSISRMQKDANHLINSIEIISFYKHPNVMEIKSILEALKTTIENQKYYIDDLQNALKENINNNSKS